MALYYMIVYMKHLILHSWTVRLSKIVIFYTYFFTCYLIILIILFISLISIIVILLILTHCYDAHQINHVKLCTYVIYTSIPTWYLNVTLFDRAGVPLKRVNSVLTKGHPPNKNYWKQQTTTTNKTEDWAEAKRAKNAAKVLITNAKASFMH